MTRRAAKYCLFTLDATVPADHLDRRYCTCGSPDDHPRHQLPDTAEADAAHRRRAGERNQP